MIPNHGQFFFGLRIHPFVLALLLISFFSLPTFASDLETLITKAKDTHLALDVQWIRLGHYQKTLLGGYRSQVKSKGFFLSPEGSRDPEKELIATLEWLFSGQKHEYEGLYEHKIEKEYARCQFPARYHWLREKLHFEEKALTAVPCERYAQFKGALAARAVSVVFSSYYLNNPSSAFGHSFLRIHKTKPEAGHSDKFELLDHGINFAAEVTTQNSLLYAIYGLAGLFRGTYSDVPFYYKVREYNDYESRDLWSYELNLTPEELDLLVAHLWELGTTHFDYYYFTQNCSYQILTAVEAAAPRYRMAEHLPSLYVIPGDTIKQLMKTPGLVQTISYRPSTRTEFRYRLSQLTSEEKDSLKDLVVAKKSSEPPPSFPADSKAKVLDAALDYMGSKHPEDLLQQNSESAKWKQKLLLARAGLQVRSPPLDLKPPFEDSPHSGHESFRVGVGGGYEAHPGYFSQLEFRFALHDLLDPKVGYPRHAKIEFLNVSSRYFWNLQRFELENLALFSVFSLNPIDSFDKGFSWRVHVSGKRFRDGNCDRCFGGTFELGGGYAVSPANPITFYLLGEIETSYSPSFYGSNLRLGIGPRGGLLLDAGPFQASIESQYRYLIFAVQPHSYQLSADLRQNFSNSFALSVKGTLFANLWESAISAYFYY